MKICLPLLFAILLAGCATRPPADVSVMPHDAYGQPAMTDNWALQMAAYNLQQPSHARGNPAAAARTLAAVEYLAGALQWNATWPAISILTKEEMRQGRQEIRQYLGIPLNAPSQPVLDALLTVADALDRNDQARTHAVLGNPLFTLGPDATLARLANLPYLPRANHAAQDAEREAFETCINGPCL